MVDPLTKIPDSAIDLNFPAPAYQNDFASIVGSAATDSDGFESIFSVLSSHVDDAAGFIAGFDGDLGALGGVAPSLGTPLEADASKTLTDTISNGQPSIDTLQQLARDQGARVWSSAVLLWLTSTMPTLWAAKATIQIQFTQLGSALTFPVHAGGRAFPWRLLWRDAKDSTPMNPIRVTMTGGDPAFERVWHDSFAAYLHHTEWNLYFDLNPKKAGDFTATVLIDRADGGAHEMAVTLHVIP